MTDIIRELQENAQAAEQMLQTLTANAASSYPILNEAMRYSLLSGGKRIRPFLVTAFATLFGGSCKVALRLGCALEMIHTYSLIHDDLPCMDNDDLRRGKPTNHKIFGEATATLAGDALLTLAFEVVTDPRVPPRTALESVRVLASHAGQDGMIGGQMIDMRGETEKLTFSQLLEMHRKKTGALIEAACLLGCYAAEIYDPSDLRCQAAVQYARNIGLAFQIVDDRLDAVGDESRLGKTIGSDVLSEKTTFLSFMSPDDALEYAEDLTEQAKEVLQKYPHADLLCALADHLLTREV